MLRIARPMAPDADPQGRSLGHALSVAGLSLLTLPYGLVQGIRDFAYRKRLLKSNVLPRPVISVGNLIAGGTGKTPFTIFLAQRLTARGHHVGILARGYRRPRGQVLNDEGLLIQRALGGAVVQVQDPDRLRGSRALLARHPQVDVLLLDDGFQHRRVSRDLDIVLMDATRPFGNGHLLPRGLLRERRSALARAHLIVITRCEQVGPETMERLATDLDALSSAPLVWMGTRASALEQGGRLHALAWLEGRPVWAACAIGHPEAFFETLRRLGARLCGTSTFPDHRFPDARGVQALCDEARNAGASFVVITRKDAMHLASLPEEVVVLDVDQSLREGEDLLDAALERAIGRPAPR